MIDKINSWLEPVKQFIIDNGKNPLFWGIIMIVFMLIGVITYNALQKEK